MGKKTKIIFSLSAIFLICGNYGSVESAKNLK